MPFVWVTLVGVGDDIDAADRNETKTNVGVLYATLGANWPGNPRFPVCAGAGYDMAAPCPVVWDIAVDDPIYQTPGAHPVSELQEARDKLDWIWDNKCAAENAAFDSGEDFGEDIGANIGEDTAEDAGDDVGANIGEDTAEDAGDDSGANIGADTGEDVGADVGANTGEEFGVNSGENIAENVGANTGEEITEDSAVLDGDNLWYEVADCNTDDIGHDVGANDPNWVANDIVDLVIVLADVSCPGHCVAVNSDDH